MRHSIDYLMGVQNALPDDVCKRLIEKFEKHPEDETIQRDTETYKFRELEITQLEEFASERDILVHSASGLMKHYKKEMGVKFFPENYVLEGLRIKKYNPHDQFDWHVDVGDANTCKRFMTIFWYLNTVEVGGHTAFDWENDDENSIIIEPKEGSALMFPPMWMFPHKGEPPMSGPKYIVSTYAHYISDTD
mgnify:FL=1|jgi:prolyl 4-hydroxylase